MSNAYHCSHKRPFKVVAGRKSALDCTQRWGMFHSSAVNRLFLVFSPAAGLTLDFPDLKILNEGSLNTCIW